MSPNPIFAPIELWADGQRLIRIDALWSSTPNAPLHRKPFFRKIVDTPFIGATEFTLVCPEGSCDPWRMAIVREIHSRTENARSLKLSGTEFDLLFKAFSEARSQGRKPLSLLDMRSPREFKARYSICESIFGGFHHLQTTSHSFTGIPESEFDMHRALIESEEMRQTIAPGSSTSTRARI